MQERFLPPQHLDANIEEDIKADRCLLVYSVFQPFTFGVNWIYIHYILLEGHAPFFLETCLQIYL